LPRSSADCRFDETDAAANLALLLLPPLQLKTMALWWTTGLLLLAVGIIVDVFFFASESTTLLLRFHLWLIAVSSISGSNGGIGASLSFVSP
jgi:hypothetical protein